MTENLSSDQQDSCNLAEAVNIKVSKLQKCISNTNKLCVDLNSLLLMRDAIKSDNAESQAALERVAKTEKNIERMIESFDKKLLETETKIDGSASY